VRQLIGHTADVEQIESTSYLITADGTAISDALAHSMHSSSAVIYLRQAGFGVIRRWAD